MNKSRIMSALLTVGFAFSALMVPAGVATAREAGISGSTSWGPCDTYTSSNLRYTSVKDKRVRVKLHETGKLGVKMRTKNENTGNRSSWRYYPTDGYQKMGKFAKKDAKFRLEFTCVNARKLWQRPSTDFEGTLDY